MRKATVLCVAAVACVFANGADAQTPAPQTSGRLAGCTVNATPTNPLPPNLPTLCVDLETSGDRVMKHAGASMLMAPSCEAWAKGAPAFGSSRIQLVATTPLAPKASGEPAELWLLVSDYAGPGSYDETKVRENADR